MIESIATDKMDIISNQMINNPIIDGSSINLASGNPVFKMLSTEDCKSFAKYIKLIGITEETNIVVLSSLHHYYYDAEEMTSIKTVINLKELNMIKELKDFLHSIFHILPPECTFVGCFVNNKKLVLNTRPTDFYYKRNSDAIENGIVSSSPFLNKIYSMIDSKTNKYMSERTVSQILGEYGFKVMDFTEIDGLTYFYAKSLRTADK
jgi:uncharacterized protein YfbU (UPF0304 family)